MKILYIITSTEMGGAETALRCLACYAKEKGHEVKIICLKELGSVGKNIRARGLDIVSFCLKGKLNPYQNMGVLARLIGEIQNFNPSVVHAMLFRAIELCRLAKRRTDFKLITTPHYDLSKKNYFLRILDRALKDADDVSVAESNYVHLFLKEKQKYNKAKLRYIPNSVNTDVFIPNKDLARKEREKLGFSAQDTLFICVARLSAEKNHQTLLKSFAAVKAKNPKMGLILVGDGPENAKLKEFVYLHHLEKDVCFAGEVSNVYPFLLASDIFVLPSLEESLPISLLESCSCALPAIVSKVGDMPQVVEHGKSGFVFNGEDSLLLSVLMAELSENKNLRQEMGLSARNRIKKYYSCSEEKYLELYQRIQ